MAPSLSRWLKSLKANLLGSRPAARPARATRLRIETLEDRSVPATHTWNSTGTFWSTASNWTENDAPNNGEAGTDVVVFTSSTPDTVIRQDIAGLVIDRIDFTTSGNILTLDTVLGLNGSGSADQITTTSAAISNTITGAALDLTGNTAGISLANGTTLTIESQITGAQGLLLRGNAGTLILTSTVDSTYTGNTNIDNGLLILNTTTGDRGLGASTSVFVGDSIGASGSAGLRLVRDLEIADNASITVRSDGLLMVMPGVREDFGNLTVNGGRLELSTTTGNDRLLVNGTVTLSGAASLGVTLVDPNAAVGTVFTLIDNDGADAISGTFSGLANGATFTSGGRTFVVSYTGGTGNDLTVTLQAQTPPAPPAPFYSGAQVFGTFLVLQGAGVQGGTQVLTVPAGSSVIFADLTGDGRGDVILFLPNLAVVVDGQTGRFLALDADDNGDGIRDFKIFNLNGTTTRTDGRTGIVVTM